MKTISYRCVFFWCKMWKFVTGAKPPPKRTVSEEQRVMQKQLYEAKRSRTVQPHWVVQYRWLIYNDDQTQMFCKVCKDFENTGTIS